jgi:hypothetical protein
MHGVDELVEQQTGGKLETRCPITGLTYVKRAEKAVKSNMKNLFTDVYDVMPRHLAEQYDECAAHLRKYPNEYPIDNFSKS